MNYENLQSKNVFETIRGISDLDVMADSLTATDLSQTLTQIKGVTVFAPRDNAFAKWPQAVMAEFQKDSARQKDLLSYHLVNQEISFEGLKIPKVVQSMQGENLTVNPIEVYTVNNVEVIKPDIFCTNGVIHIIDKVLDPYERV